MPKSSGQKLKLLHLLNILQTESDESHPLTVNFLIAALSQRGISAERKSIYSDLQLLEDFGYDIVCRRARQNTYFLGERQFETAELKLLADAVQAAKFVSDAKSRTLIKKLTSFASRHEASVMQRHVVVQGRAKTENEQVYYNVDALHSAINLNSSIECFYYEYRLQPAAQKGYERCARHGGKSYLLSPHALLWDNENYYLLAYDHADEKIKHFRTDKLGQIKLTCNKREGGSLFEKIDLAEYSMQTFGMFGGTQAQIKLWFNAPLIGVVIDRFGKNIHLLPDADGAGFCISIKAVISPQFFAWLFGFGNEAKILSPHWAAQQMKKTAEEVAGLYL